MVGVIVTVLVMAAPVAFVAVNAGIFPEPLAAKPTAVLLFVHAKVAPTGTLANVVRGTDAPAQTLTLAGAVMVGTALTVTVVDEVQVIVPEVAVTVYVYVPAAAGAVNAGGFLTAEVYPEGPVHAYEYPAPAFVADKVKEPPAQTGPLLLAVTTQVPQGFGAVKV